MTVALYVEVIQANSIAIGWTVSAWPASIFPNNPTPGAPAPHLTSPTATGASAAPLELTGLTAATAYWLQVQDPIAGVNRWFPVPTARLGNSSGDPFIVVVPQATTIATADIIFDQSVGSLVIWATDE